MLELFYNKNNTSHREFTAPNTENLNNRMRTYLELVKEYFYKSNTRVRSEHILYKILLNLGINPEWSKNDISYYVDTVMRGLLKPMGVSSEINIDVIHPRSTIIKNATEIIYSISSYSQLDIITKIGPNSWKSLEPLKFVNHNFMDLYFNHPTRIDTVKEDIIVYTLDIKVLAIMFKYYMIEEKLNNRPTSISEFIARYVLTNSMNSMADISILNNYLNKGYIYIDNRQSIGATSVQIHHNMLNDIISKSLISRSNDRLNIIEVLKNIHLLNNNGYELLLLPRNFYETSRSKKYIVIVLFDFINKLTNYLQPYKDGNSQYYTDLKYYLKTLSNLHIVTTKEVDEKATNIIEELRSKI